MLKPADPPNALPRPDDERPVGELVHELIEDGKAYARAELDLGKAIATEKANALKLPAMLFGGAFLLLIAAAVALGTGLLLALEPLAGPLPAGVLTLVILAGIAGGLAWFGVRKIREDL